LTAGNFDATTGQPSNATVATQFIRDSYNWLAVSNNNLWGNGHVIDYNFGSSAYGAVPENSATPTKYYQETKWVIPQNNPCPSGFRVPTQDEWERIGAYDCNPNFADGSITSIPAAGETNSHGLIWVPVVCGATSGNCKAENWANATRSGYAIYAADDWDATRPLYQNDLTNPAAKEPLLFLPAAGNRSVTGDQNYVGEIGVYWSSTVNETLSYTLGFAAGGVYPGDTASRAVGFSLRCVAD
jgi:hypothetical protein